MDYPIYLFYLLAVTFLWVVICFIFSFNQERFPPPLLAIIASFSIVAQPHSGEIFFTLTNTQWLIAPALAMYFLSKGGLESRHVVFSGMLVILASLTGPFSIMITPYIALRKLLDKKIWQWSPNEMLILVASMIQLFFVAFSDHSLYAREANMELSNWLHFLLSLILFGNYSWLGVTSSILLWILWAFCLASGDSSRSAAKNPVAWKYLFLIAITFLLAGAYAMRDNPGLASPLGWGARYYYPVYAILLFSFWLCLKACKPVVRLLSSIIILSICVQGFVPVKREQTHFIDLAKGLPESGYVNLPINPIGWRLEINSINN